MLVQFQLAITLSILNCGRIGTAYLPCQKSRVQPDRTTHVVMFRSVICIGNTTALKPKEKRD